MSTETRPDAHQRARERFLPSLWAENHRLIGSKPWSFAGYEYLRDIHDDMSREIVVEKAAQLGFTEMAQNRLVHSIDFQTDGMVVFPTDDDAKRHSKARFKALLDASPYIKSIFREVDAVDVKRSLDTALYFEGSNSGSALYSVPIGFLVVDEMDRCVQDALEAAAHRLDGHLDPISMFVSTPTIPDFGVSRRWKESDRKRWHVTCPAACGWTGPLTGDGPELERWDVITWEGKPTIPKDSDESWRVAQTARVCCPSCGATFTESARLAAVAAGSWVAENPGAPISGYSINQLCSPTQDAVQIVHRYFKAVHDQNPEKLRQYVNQVLGKPFLGAGEAITVEMVRECAVPAVARESYGHCVGADIGKVIHVAQGDRDEHGRLSVRRFLELPDWDALENFIRRESPLRAVVDRYPETSKSEALCAAFPATVYRAEHPEGMREMYSWDTARQVVQIREVDAVDVLLTRIRKKSLLIDRRELWELAVDHLTHITTTTDVRSGKPIRRVLHKVGGRDDLALAAIYLDAAASLVSVSGGATADWAEDKALSRELESYGQSDPSFSRLMVPADPFDDDLALWEAY